MTVTDRIVVFAVIAGSWALIALADILARGYASAHASAQVVTVPYGLRVVRPDLRGADEEGWVVSALKVTPGSDNESGLSYLVTKPDHDPEWIDGGDPQILNFQTA